MKLLRVLFVLLVVAIAAAFISNSDPAESEFAQKVQERHQSNLDADE